MKGKLRILVVHNRYQQRGGEDTIVDNEVNLLVSKGHDVKLLMADNDHITNIYSKVQAAVSSIYSLRSKLMISTSISEYSPDIVHAHNVFPTISSSITDACRERGVPLVRTLNNYRLICPNALLYRSGHVCEQCTQKQFAWPGVVHACYRESRAGTFVIALGSFLEQQRASRKETAGHFIVGLTAFGLSKMENSCVAGSHFYLKSNFLYPDPVPGTGAGGYFLFVGRLTTEKGVRVLLEAWKSFENPMPLIILGTGPLADECNEASKSHSTIVYLGPASRPETHQMIANAYAVIVPSLWYEGFPLTIVESLAHGTPVIASDLGAMQSVIDHQRTGLLFSPGDTQSLRDQISWLTKSPERAKMMRQHARAEYEERYTSEQNYKRLLEIYEQVIACNNP